MSATPQKGGKLRSASEPGSYVQHSHCLRAIQEETVRPVVTWRFLNNDMRIRERPVITNVSQVPNPCNIFRAPPFHSERESGQ